MTELLFPLPYPLSFPPKYPRFASLYSALKNPSSLSGKFTELSARVQHLKESQVLNGGGGIQGRRGTDMDNEETLTHCGMDENGLTNVFRVNSHHTLIFRGGGGVGKRERETRGV